MIKIKKILLISIVLLILSFRLTSFVYAEGNVDLTIRSGENILFKGSVPLAPAGTIQLNGHDLDANSVLAVINDADVSSEGFSVDDLQYYDSYGSFYLKCINNLCDNWQYTINDKYSTTGLDKNILSGGESIYLYFGSQHQISLNQNLLNTKESLIVNAQNYVYQDNSWEPLPNINIGITQPDPNNPWSPTELQVQKTDSSGKTVFSGLTIGSYKIGIKEDFYSPSLDLIVNEAPVQQVIVSSGSSILPNNNIIFNQENAYNFLASQQKKDGSFGEELYTDWASLAFSATDSFLDQKIKLTKYFNTHKILEKTLTDYERHAMALMAMKLNPSNINGENYIQKIIAGFDGQQFGDKENENDDIFALIVLINNGYGDQDMIINKTIDFIISKQKNDGSWHDSIDLTGAAILSLSKFKDTEKVSVSLEKAKVYLRKQQKDDGSWGNVSSTSWALEGIYSLGEKKEAWTKGDAMIDDYLSLNQEIDGSIKTTKEENIGNKIWQTSYVLSIFSGKSWNEVMSKFEKIEIPKIISKKQFKNTKKIIIPKIENIKNLDSKTTAIFNQNKEEPLKTAPILKRSIFRRIWSFFGIN